MSESTPRHPRGAIKKINTKKRLLPSGNVFPLQSTESSARMMFKSLFRDNRGQTSEFISHGIALRFRE